MYWELSKGGERRKATPRIPLEILLRSCSSSEVVVEGSKSQDEEEIYRRSFNDDKKEKADTFLEEPSRGSRSFTRIHLYLISRVPPDIISQLVGKS